MAAHRPQLRGPCFDCHGFHIWSRSRAGGSLDEDDLAQLAPGVRFFPPRRYLLPGPPAREPSRGDNGNSHAELTKLLLPVTQRRIPDHPATIHLVPDKVD